MFQFQQPQNTNNVANLPNQDKWKNDAFVNIYLPRADGTVAKLGSIGLKLTKSSDKAVIEYLKADPSRLARLLATATVDFRMADGSDNADLVLPE